MVMKEVLAARAAKIVQVPGATEYAKQPDNATVARKQVRLSGCSMFSDVALLKD